MNLNIAAVIILNLGIFSLMVNDFNEVKAVIANLRGKAAARLKKGASEALIKKRVNSVEREIYQSASLLENIIILQKDAPKGAAYIIEQIASYSKELKKPFESMLYYLRLNQREEAAEAFKREAGTKSAKEYADILIRMDSINPADLRENVSMLRRRLREESITREKKKNEVISDIVYIPVLANVMIIFVNFIYISYYAEQKELFQQLLF